MEAPKKGKAFGKRRGGRNVDLLRKRLIFFLVSSIFPFLLSPVSFLGLFHKNSKASNHTTYRILIQEKSPPGKGREHQLQERLHLI